MEQAVGARGRSRAMVWLMAVVVLVGMMMGMSPGRARAITVDEVDRTTIAAVNPLTIMSRTMMDDELGKSPGKVSLVSSNTTCNSTRLTSAFADAYDQNTQRHYIGLYREGIITSMAGEMPSGLLLEFPKCDSAGDTAQATVRYPIIGMLDGHEVGATVSYTFHWSQLDWVGSYGYTAVQICDSLYGGIDMCNASSVDVAISFTDASSGEAVAVPEGTYLTLGSISYFGNTQGVGDREYLRVADGVTSRLVIPARDTATGGNCKVVQSGGMTRAEAASANGWTDDISDEDFYRNSASAYQTGAQLAFTAGRSSADAQSPANGQMWWTLSSASITVPTPDDPLKTASKTSGAVGESVHYEVSQKVHTAGVDIMTKYVSFIFRDVLPAQLDYTADTAHMYRGSSDGTRTDVTGTDGAFSYDAATRTLTYTFAAGALEQMPMTGETYIMAYDATIDDSAVAGSVVSNFATVRINAHESTVSADVAIDSLVPAKTATPTSGTSVVPGQVITYAISYTNDSDRAVSVALTDVVPGHTSYVEGSLKALESGPVPTSTDDATVDGKTGRIEMSASWDSVAVGKTVSYSFTVIVDADAAAGQSIDNVAYLVRDGSAAVATNTTTHPVVSVEVALTKASDPAPGTRLSSDGAPVTYRLTLTNAGDSTVYRYIVRDAIPDFTTFASSTDMQTVEIGGKTYVWSKVDELGSGQSVTLSFTVQASAYSAIGTRYISNVAEYVGYPATEKADPTVDAGWVQSNELLHVQENDESDVPVDPLHPTGRDGLPWALAVAAGACIIAAAVLAMKGRKGER